MSSTLHIEGTEIQCSACEHTIAEAGSPWKQAASLSETPMRGAAGVPYSGGERVVLRRFACPGCGALLDTETALPEDPFLNDVLFDRGGF
jgi:acetone carboxylase gamma subunit